MEWRIEVANREKYFDAVAAGTLADIRDLGITSVEEVRLSRVYYVEGALDRVAMERVASHLLADRVVEEYSFGHIEALKGREGRGARVVEVIRKPGVMDPVESSALKGIADLGYKANSVRTSRKYILFGKVTEKELTLIASKVLANESIEEIVPGEHPSGAARRAVSPYRFSLRETPILRASDEELKTLSKSGQLFLNLAEMRAIRDHFKTLSREPTDVELESLAQTWSEHCVHKTLKGQIDYNGRVIDNLLASTVMRVTTELDKPWCISVFKDNAGVIEFTGDFALCFKVETHNHPSAIEPYGGAGTGIGGVIRDPMGTGVGAKPIFNTDAFCFAPPDIPYRALPKGVLHPKKVFKGVVAGVRDYGNRMGIPTINGAIYFDERYLGNPLVYCGTCGLIPRDKCFKRVDPGDIIVLVGGRTGRDGIHGATFSSAELTEESEVVSSSAVQIGNAITEKKMLDVILAARDRGLYKAITDCGGGGLSSAVGEMGEPTGAEVHLERVPLKYQGLSYTEIWISEAQERMILAVEPGKESELLRLFSSEDVEATVIGRFTDDRRLRLFYLGHLVADLSMEFLHRGYPRPIRKAVWREPVLSEPKIRQKPNYKSDVLAILASPNVASKEWVIRQYDHEVQGASVLKPLVGASNDGPGDASVMAPIPGAKKGVIVSCGFNPMYGDLDPYHMAASAIDEAIRQIIAVGGSMKEIALLDNFCWGNTEKPDRLGGLVRAALACYDTAKAYGTPFISGKDSLNNEYATASGTISIPPSLLISAIGVMEDVTKAVSMDLKEQGNLIYIVGLTKNELGGSHYYFIHGHRGKNVPKVDTALGLSVFNSLSCATEKGLVRSCHDLSEGGLAIAAAEMAFAGEWGMTMDLRKVPTTGKPTANRDDTLLFSESNSRLLAEVRPSNQKAFETALAGAPYGLIGKVTKRKRLGVKGLSGRVVIDADIFELKEAWQKTFKGW